MEYHLKVATLNFSGINVSPFEYHDGSPEKTILDKTFKNLLDKYTEDNPKAFANLAKLDKVFQKERYTILYRTDCGCVRGRLLTKEQFEIVWDRTFDLNQGIVGHMGLSDQNIDKLRSFDFMIYKAYLCALFGEVNMDELDRYSSRRYIQQLKKWHSRAYLDSTLKINYVKEYLIDQQLDVLFLQQALTDRGRQYLPSDDYSFVKNADSMIIFKKESYFLQDFKDAADFDQDYKELLNFNKDSCYYKCKDLLLMSVHLSSKKSNIQQAKQMFQVLKRIQKQCRDLKIVIGVDANHKLSNNSSFSVFPELDLPTTRKKRTSLQCQFQKANKLVEESKDFIITNISISSSRIQTIKSWDVTYDLLPNDEHPFDHFVVSAHLEFDKPEYRSRASSYLKHFVSPIKILIEQSTKQNSEKSFGQIVEDLFARIVPPEASQPFRGFRKTIPVACHNLSGQVVHRNLSAPRVMSSVNLDQQHIIKWDFMKKGNGLCYNH